MILRRPLLLLLPLASGTLLAVACFSSSNNPGNGGLDSGADGPSSNGLDSGADGPPGHDGGTAPPDGSQPLADGSQMNADGGGEDSGIVSVSHCSAPLRIDTVAGAAPEGLHAEAFGDKYVVVWPQYTQVSTDGKTHVKARAFDGSALGGEIDLGIYVNSVLRVSSDDAGHAFAQWSAQSGPVRAVFDFSTMTFSPPAAFGAASPYVETDVASGGAGSGLSIYRQSDGTLAADRWRSDGGWQSTGLSETATIAQAINELRLFSNGAGQAVASWYSATNTFWATPFDGGAWGALTTTQADSGYGVQAWYVVLSNGDAIYMFEYPDSIQASRFRASSGTWDAPAIVSSIVPAIGETTGRHRMVVDSSDRLTISWSGIVSGVVHTFASRSFDQGAHWSAPADFGPSNFVALGVQPSTSNVVAATYGNGNTNSGLGFGSDGISLRATTPTGTTWSAPSQTGVDTNQGSGGLDRSARVIFTTAGVVLVAMQGDPDAGFGLTVQAVTCKL